MAEAEGGSNPGPAVQRGLAISMPYPLNRIPQDFRMIAAMASEPISSRRWHGCTPSQFTAVLQIGNHYKSEIRDRSVNL